MDQAQEEEEESSSLTPNCQPTKGKKNPRDGADGADEDGPGRLMEGREGGKIVQMNER